MSQFEKLTSVQLGIIEDADGAIKVDELTIPPPPLAALTNDVPENRLIITNIVVKNFKSYAGEQVLGPFNKNFTAVVGPNGSGKSNVIDSLLFVFGYKARKIRSKKISELIHKSKKFPNLNSCSVTINLATIRDEGENCVVLPDSRFSLKRTAFADDTSYYEICNKRVPYRELVKTLRAYGIDMDHSRFLILQGEIEAISLMHPKAINEHDTGMLEYCEDIIGSNRFIEPIQHFREKVTKMNEEHKEKFKELKLVEKEKDDLEGPKNKAVEYLRLENRQFLTENSLLLAKRLDAENEFESTVQSKKEFIKKMEVLKTQLEDVRQSKKLSEQELGKLNSEYEILLKTLEEAKEHFRKLSCEDAGNIENAKHAKAKKEDLEKKLITLKTEMSKQAKQSSTYEKETAELEVKKKKLEVERDKERKLVEEVGGAVKQETDKLKEKKDKLEQSLRKLNETVSQIKSEMDLTKSELDLYVSGEKNEKEQLSSLHSNCEKTTNAVKEQERLLEQEEEQIAKHETDLNALRQKLSHSKQSEGSLSEQLKNTRFKLEEAKSSMNTFRHRGTMMQAFMREKASGRLTGVYGRLGDLGAIDEKYDIAISTACGQLDNIVTDTLATAQKCVEFLKRNNLGYTTFIPLDKMKTWEPYAQRKIATPENVPRLFDLVRVKDTDVLPAFYFALRDTLVANDLAKATRIGLQGKQRYRVVTLKGELIDLAGTMSGGGGRVQFNCSFKLY